MESLLCSQSPPLRLAELPPFKSRDPGILSVVPHKLGSPSRKWRLQANARGFSGTPPFLKGSATDKNSNKNNNDDDEEVPQVVIERIIARILVSVGAPLAVGLVLLHYFGVVKEQRLWDVPLWLPVLTTFVTFGASTLGIAYGALSTSWDADKKGSVLGFEQAQKNWVEVWKEENN